MNYDFKRLTSFAEAKRVYKSIKPVREIGYGVTRNIRPIGDRNNRYARIVKKGSTCYYVTSADYKTCESGFASILFTIDSAGFERIRVLNETIKSTSSMRYEQFKHLLPFDYERTAGGDSYLTVNGKRYYLPRGDYPNNNLVNMVARSNHGVKARDLAKYDYHYFEASRPLGGEWTVVSPEYQRLMSRIDKALKAQCQSDLSRYRDWLLSVNHVIVADRETHHRAAGELLVYINNFNEGCLELFKDIGFSFTNGGFAASKMSSDAMEVVSKMVVGGSARESLIDKGKEAVRHILSEEGHPMWVPLATIFICSQGINSKGERAAMNERMFRSAYNTWINNICGFTKNVPVQVS